MHYQSELELKCTYIFTNFTSSTLIMPHSVALTIESNESNNQLTAQELMLVSYESRIVLQRNNKHQLKQHICDMLIDRFIRNLGNKFSKNNSNWNFKSHVNCVVNRFAKIISMSYELILHSTAGGQRLEALSSLKWHRNLHIH